MHSPGWATSEVDRYIVWPGQAPAYLIGMLEILRLRDEAQARLGEEFDLAGFHDAILRHGSVPLAVLLVVVFALLLGAMAVLAADVKEHYKAVLDLALALAGYTQGALLAGPPRVQPRGDPDREGREQPAGALHQDERHETGFQEFEMMVLTKKRSQVGSHRIDQFHQLGIRITTEIFTVFAEVSKPQLPDPARQS